MNTTPVTRAQFLSYWHETFTYKFQNIFGLELTPEAIARTGDGDKSAVEHQWSIIHNAKITEDEMIADGNLFFKIACKIRDGAIEPNIPPEELLNMTCEACKDLEERGMLTDKVIDNLDMVAAKSDDPEQIEAAHKKLDKLIQNDLREILKEAEQSMREEDEQTATDNTITPEQFAEIINKQLNPALKKYAPDMALMTVDAQVGLLQFLQKAKADKSILENPIGGMLQLMENLVEHFRPYLDPARIDKAISVYFQKILLETLKGVTARAFYNQHLRGEK